MKFNTTWSNYMAAKKAASRKKKSAKRRPTREPSQLKLMNLKASSKDRAAITSLARKYADGNISAWLRTAGMNYVPNKRRA